jgi:DNA-binding CsgD family transcriptional regulator
MKSRKSDARGFCNDLSFSQKLREAQKSNEAFEIMLSVLTLEEIIGLKLECSSRLTGGRLYGFNLWSKGVEIIKEALYSATISVAHTNKEACRILGVSEYTLKSLKKKYKIREEDVIEIE